jgi:CubicO group peptidase (beta-lactamase class C family)
MKFSSAFFTLFLFLPAFLSAQDFTSLDSVVNKNIENKLFPGASVAVGNEQGIIYSNYYGHFTYDKNSKNVDSLSLFDMASCTKVLATTSCAMKLYDEGKLDIEESVCRFIPDFGVNGKEKVKVRNLLLHNSGLQAYLSPIAGDTKSSIYKKIFSLPLKYKTDSSYVYSCLNFITLRKIVETVSGKTMDKYYKENFTEPMGLTRTMFCPAGEEKKNCLPTTDSLQGIVHDPLARVLEGESGNAGLFSNVTDISKICCLFLNNGVFNGKRYISEATVKYFTKKFDNRSDRALGWDTKAESNNSSSGSYTSPLAYGHTGYTGTSVWIDPVKKIFVILLTNRVYPDDKVSVSEVRRAVADAALRACLGRK